MSAMMGVTTRPVTLVAIHPTTRRTMHTEMVPAGTEVYVRETRRGFEIRLPGTNLAQDVYPSAVVPA